MFVELANIFTESVAYAGGSITSKYQNRTLEELPEMCKTAAKFIEGFGTFICVCDPADRNPEPW
eukprot:6880532-Karenia_brevis.AAC.1